MTGLEPLLLGSAAAGGTAATAGLFGAGGAFTLGSTLSTLGTAFSALSSITQANSASSAANFNARVAQRNAVIERQNAAADASKADRLARIRAGTNRATAGASGGGIAGSALDLLEDNALEEALSIATIRQQGEITASGFETTAAQDRMRAKSERTKGFVGAGSQLLLGTSRSFTA
jgi:hypothetical protein